MTYAKSIVPIIVLTFFGVACSEDVAFVEPGRYQTEDLPPDELASISLIIEVDPEAGTFVFPDGQRIEFTYASLPESEWYYSCPTNFGATLSEVVKLDLDEITLGSRVIKNPVVKSICFSDYIEVVEECNTDDCDYDESIGVSFHLLAV